MRWGWRSPTTEPATLSSRWEMFKQSRKLIYVWLVGPQEKARPCVDDVRESLLLSETVTRRADYWIVYLGFVAFRESERGASSTRSRSSTWATWLSPSTAIAWLGVDTTRWPRCWRSCPKGRSSPSSWRSLSRPSVGGVVLSSTASGVVWQRWWHMMLC